MKVKPLAMGVKKDSLEVFFGKDEAHVLGGKARVSARLPRGLRDERRLVGKQLLADQRHFFGAGFFHIDSSSLRMGPNSVLPASGPGRLSRSRMSEARGSFLTRSSSSPPSLSSEASVSSEFSDSSDDSESSLPSVSSLFSDSSEPSEPPSLPSVSSEFSLPSLPSVFSECSLSSVFSESLLSPPSLDSESSVLSESSESSEPSLFSESSLFSLSSESSVSPSLPSVSSVLSLVS